MLEKITYSLLTHPWFKKKKFYQYYKKKFFVIFKFHD